MCIYMKWTLNNEEGFTLLETLLSLLISSLVILLLTGGILQVVAIRENVSNNAQESSRSHVITGDRQVEWHIFLNQLENYLQDSFEPQVVPHYIQVKEEEAGTKEQILVRYSQDSNERNLSRKAANGNQRMLTGIKRIAFKRAGGWLTVEVTFINNDRYNGRIWLESWVEQELPEAEKTENVTTDDNALEEGLTEQETIDETSKNKNIEEGVIEDERRESNEPQKKTSEIEETQEEIPKEKIVEEEAKDEEE